MIYEFLKNIFLILLILIALLGSLGIGYIIFVARGRADLQTERRRYVFTGAGLGFLTGASLSSFMAIDAFTLNGHFDFRVLPMLLCFSLVPAVFAVVLISRSLQSYEQWRKHYGGHKDGRAEREE